MQRLKDFFTVPVGDPELTRSQLRAYSKQVPLLYVILVANTLFVAATHYRVAPGFLTLFIPAALSVICLTRLRGWLKLTDRDLPHDEALARLRATVRLTWGVGLGFTMWGLALSGYGDAYQRMHVVFYMAITTIACVFCLMHVRAAAFGLTLVATVPTAIYFGSRGESVLTAVAANFVLVAVTMLIVLVTHYRNFALLIDQQRELSARQRETQRLSDENMRMALADSLTGLPNRRSFFGSIEHELSRAADSSAGFAVGLIDLDGFKAVNDLYGHATGDAVLVEASRRMVDLSDGRFIFARLGGDEFGVILPDCASGAVLAKFGQDLCAHLKRTYALASANVEISASVGFATYPDAGNRPASLLDHADYALYRAKQHAMGTAIIFSGEHADDIKRLYQVEQALRVADFDRELSLAFHGIFDASSNELRAVEALARWNSPVLGAVPPSTFIRAAERSDLVNRITITLFRRALNEMVALPQDVALSFNLSARDIASSATILKLVSLAVHGPISTRRIIFEVTETAVMVDFDQAVKSLSELRGIGARIALDDFGSGHSSLGYVHRLPLDEIKIDGSFTAGLIGNDKVRSIFKTIVDLSRNLGLVCVAEGVERPEQARLVAELGCNLVQGYHFGMPRNAELFAACATPHCRSNHPYGATTLRVPA